MERDDEFEALFRKYERLLYAYLVKVLNVPKLDAEDLVIETFQGYFEKYDQYRDANANRLHFRGDPEWMLLRRIARQRYLDMVRSRHAKKRRPQEVPMDDLRSEPLEPRAPDTPLFAREASRRVRRAIAKLRPPKQQSILLLQMEGLSYAEIAELLDIPLSDVKVGLYAAKKVIREILDSETPSVDEVSGVEDTLRVPHPARHLNVWLEDADPPLRLDVDYRIGADIGAPHLDAVASNVFREPHWGDREELRVVLVLTADHARVIPKSRRAVLPRIGNMRPVFFTVRALDAEQVRFRLDVVTEREGDVLESVSFVLEVAHAEKAVAR